MQYCTKCGMKLERRTDNLYVCAEGHENWVNAICGTVIYIVRDSTVLYGVRSIEPHKGGLDVPGGFLDLNETIEQSVHREAAEEMGVTISTLDYLGSYVSDYAGRQIINIAYVARLSDDSPGPQPGDDMNGGDPAWREIDNLPTHDELAWPWQLTAQIDLVKWYSK